MKRKREKIKFIYFPILLFLVIVLIGTIALGFMWRYLVEYEKSDPRSYVEDFVDLIKEKKYEEAMEAGKITPHGFFDVNQYKAFVDPIVNKNPDKVELYEISMQDPSVKRFEIASEGEEDRIVVELNEIGKLKYDLPLYELKQVNEFPSIVYDIYAPSGGTVIVNGISLDSNYVTNDNIAVEGFNYLNDQTNVPTTRQYTVDGFVKQPEIDFIPDSSEINYDISFEDDRVVITTSPDSETVDALTEIATSAASAYAEFVARDGDFGMFYKYLYPETEYYTFIRDFDNSWYIDHESHEIRDMKAFDFREYSNGFYTCEISYVYNVKKWNIDEDYPAHYLVSFIKTGDSYQIISLETL